MGAGRLNRRIKIQRRGSGTDGYGNTLGGWVDLITGEPAEIRPMRSGVSTVETIDAAKITAAGYVEILLRHSSRTAQALTTDRIVNERTGEAFNIRSIENPDMRGKYLRLVCQAGVADG